MLNRSELDFAGFEFPYGTEPVHLQTQKLAKQKSAA